MRYALLLLPACLLYLAFALSARAQGTDATGTLHFGAGSCAAQACHGGGFPDRMEYKIWATEDRHSKAYESLAGELGQRIGRRLGIDPTRDESCLCCHGTTGVALAETFDQADGVSCELCHGGARDWLGPHAAPEWKDRTPAQKAALGLADLSTPEARAAACTGCHVGGEGREIPHTIMAAGHPPLAFDAAKYLRDLPPHWRDEHDLTVPTWVAGLKANAAAALERVARAALSRQGWPEFGVFDCYACHHAIYTGSVYETGDPPGRPGDLPLDLADLRVLLVAAGDEALLERFGTTHAPGGDARALGKRAREMAEEVRALLPDAGRYGPADAGRFLANLARHVETERRIPKHRMQIIAFAIESLSGKRPAALLEALEPGKPYDGAAAARLARDALAR